MINVAITKIEYKKVEVDRKYEPVN